MDAFATTDGIRKDFSNINNAIDYIAGIEKTDEDIHAVPSTDVKFHGGELIIAGNAMPVTCTAYQQILTKIGIPSSFVKRCPNNLMAVNIRKMLKEHNKTPWRIRTRLDVDGERYVRAVVTEKYKPLIDSDVLTRARDDSKDISNDPWDIKFSDDAMRATKTLDDTMHPTADVGDITKAGVEIINGTTGQVKFSIGMFLYRLVCSNGLVVPERMAGMSKRHIGSEFYNSYSESFYNILDAIDTVSTKWGAISQSTIQDARSAVINSSRLATEAIIGRKETRDIFDEQVNASSTVYTLMNIITARAKSIDDIIARRSLESAGGILLLAA